MKKLLKKLMGSYSDREIKRIIPIVEDIEDLEPVISKLTDDELKAKTVEFKKKLTEGLTLDDILPEAFAVVREVSWRVLGMKHFRVQLIGGIVLHQGRISEMKTGEGKTLVATLPAYLNALSGKGVHIVTVNDYLAKRDSEWMGEVFRFLGLTVGLNVHDLDNAQRKKAYDADITYGTNNEFGFDYLRDNMVIYKEEMVQRELNYSIIDEVDSILIDEARTPLIISGAGDKSTDLYKSANQFVKKLKHIRIVESDDKVLDDDVESDYIVDEKAKSCTLTKQGMIKAEQAFGIENLSDPDNLTLSHHINQAIKAHGIMKRDIDYVVKDGEVLIVDEFTGRLMFGRRYSEGLHQAIEAKEGVKIERESKTLATITFQNYFRMYKKLSGMTGTALTEEEEFRSIYNLDVIEIPTNKPMLREDKPDIIYRNEAGKFRAVVKDIAESYEKCQPVLVGTISIEKSEHLSKLLKKEGIKHEVLNAKFHEKEAEIVAQAGKKGSVTIATNMAGRGTDIVLGGNAEFMAKNDLRKKGYDEHTIYEATGYANTNDEEVIEARKIYRQNFEKYTENTSKEKEDVIKAGGLKIIGTERHESRRIDNQLRGRSGRQGDPGGSRFYISMEDDLMRLFGSDRLTTVVDALGMDEDQPLEHKMLSNAIENAQKRVEGKNFSIRKHVLQYDDVMNQQREVIYKQRQQVLNGESLKSAIDKMINSVVESIVDLYTSDSEYPDDWNLKSLIEHAERVLLKEGTYTISREQMEDLTKDVLLDDLKKLAFERYEEREKEVTFETMREVERVIMLKVVDQKWMDHIDAMDQLRRGIGLRAYGQRDPVVEYKFEGYDMFEEMIRNIQTDVVTILFNASFEKAPKREAVAKPTNTNNDDSGKSKPVVKKKKIGRNEPCPCGSGKKYKKCCGRNI